MLFFVHDIPVAGIRRLRNLLIRNIVVSLWDVGNKRLASTTSCRKNPVIVGVVDLEIISPRFL